MKLPYASEKKNLGYFYWKTYKIFNVWWFRTYLTTYGLNPKGWQWLILQAISTHSEKKKQNKICHFSHVLGSNGGEPPEKSLCSWAQTTRRVCMQYICSSLVSIFALVTLKERKKHFWREKAHAPVNVCPFRNRLFCIRSDIHCDCRKAVKTTCKNVFGFSITLFITYCYTILHVGMWNNSSWEFSQRRLAERKLIIPMQVLLGLFRGWNAFCVCGQQTLLRFNAAIATQSRSNTDALVVLCRACCFWQTSVIDAWFPNTWWVGLRFTVPVNNFSVMSGLSLPGFYTVLFSGEFPPVGIEPRTSPFGVWCSTTMPLRSPSCWWLPIWMQDIVICKSWLYLEMPCEMWVTPRIFPPKKQEWELQNLSSNQLHWFQTSLT